MNNGCTCGPYLSIIPPEPCPLHDPERAYWRAKLLSEFPNYGRTYTTTSAKIDPLAKECGWMGCGREQCNEVCCPTPQ